MVTNLITTYDELLTAGADWLNRGDLVDQMPTFVRLAEAQLNRDLRVRDMMVRAETTSDLENVELPNDFLEHYSLQLVPPGQPLMYMSERESNDVKAAGIAGPVAGYTILDNMIELVPAPSGDVDLKMVYYARIPSLGATTPSNWLLVKSPDLYLFSTLLQATPYLKDDERIAVWGQARVGVMESMRLESEASMRPRAGYLVARPSRSF